MNYEDVDFSLVGTYPRYRPAKTELKKLNIEESKQIINPKIEINDDDEDEDEESKEITPDTQITFSPEVKTKEDPQEPINIEDVERESQEQEKIEAQLKSIESKLSIFKSKTIQKFAERSSDPKVKNEKLVVIEILNKLELVLEKLGNDEFNDFLLFQFSNYLSVFSHQQKEYEGFFDNKFESGFGYVKAKRFQYIGSIARRDFEGLGVMIHEGGGLYIGNWKKGKREGYGRYTWPDGAEYNGNFNNGDMQGNGTFMYTNKDLFKGEFKNNVRDGKGRYFYKSSNYLDFDEGSWKGGEMTGKAVIVREGEEKEIMITKKS